MAEVPKHVGAT